MAAWPDNDPLEGKEVCLALTSPWGPDCRTHPLMYHPFLGSRENLPLVPPLAVPLLAVTPAHLPWGDNQASSPYHQTMRRQGFHQENWQANLDPMTQIPPTSLVAVAETRPASLVEVVRIR